MEGDETMMNEFNENIHRLRKEKESLAYRNIRLYNVRRKISKTLTNIFFMGLVIGLSFVILYPFLKLFPLVFNRLDEIGRPNAVWIPQYPSVKSFQIAYYLLTSIDKLIILKSLLYALVIAIIQTFVSAMAGYSLARVNFKGKGIIFAIVILTFIVPPQATLISQYLRFKDFDIFGIFKAITGDKIDLINKPITLYLLAIFGFGVKQSLFIFIFRQFFVSIPHELEEAAVIDGCGFYRTYFRVMLPNAIPAILTVLVFAFVWNYGDTYYTYYFHPKGPYLSIVLNRTFQENQFDFVKSLAWYRFDVMTFTTFSFDAVKQAALLIFLAPLLVLYFIIQKRFVENFEAAGIVG